MTRGKIVELLTMTNRPGIDNLIRYMDENGFFTAPCSGQYHLCREGGLADHSLNVHDIGLAHMRSLIESVHALDSWTLVSLLHDLGKMSQFGKPTYVENRLKSGQLSTAKPYHANSELLPIPHEIRSVNLGRGAGILGILMPR